MIKSDVKLKAARLTLRPFEKSDLESVQGYYALPEVQRYLDWKSRDAGESKLALDAMRKQTRLTRPGDVLTMAVVRNADGVVMGHVSIKWTDATAAQGEIRFAIAPQFRRLGYGAHEGDGGALAVCSSHMDDRGQALLGMTQGREQPLHPAGGEIDQGRMVGPQARYDRVRRADWVIHLEIRWKSGGS